MLNAKAGSSWIWTAAAFLLVLGAAISLRLGTNVLNFDNKWDEKFTRIPIEDLIHKGWTVETAIDFTESKGPTLIWTYAALGEPLGGSLNDLRLITVMFFVLGAVPLLIIARLCGLDGPVQIAVAMFYVLLPQNAVLGQLLMSEPSFVFGGLVMMLAFVWGFGRSTQQERRIAGPVLFAIALSLLLHNRIHAVAFAAAVALVAFERDGVRSWPWWLACLVAGISRIPLWVRWGGLVAPDYQHLHSLGIRFDSLTYLAAAMVPLTAVFLWPALFSNAARGRRWMMIAGAAVGVGLALLAPASTDRLQLLDIPGTKAMVPQYQGFAATVASTLSQSVRVQTTIIGLMAIVGLASLGALAALCLGKSFEDRHAITARLQMWTLLTGWAMYMMTQGYVFDRFIYAWAILMPIVWVRQLPFWLAALQALGLLGILAITINKYLI